MDSGPPTFAGGPGIKTNDKCCKSLRSTTCNKSMQTYANYNPGWYHSWGTESNFLT